MSTDEVDASTTTLANRVSAALERLSPSETRVAQYVQAMPVEELIFTNAGQLGRLTRTSDATVVRTARKLGYTGLPELKREAGNGLGAAAHPKERLSQRIAALGSDIGSIRQQIVADAIESLELTRDAVDDADLQTAVGALAHADTIFTFGYGGSEHGASHLARMLARMGYDTRAIGDTGLLLADALMQVGHGDAVVVFQPGRVLRDIEVILEHANSVGATTILVSGERLHDQLAGSYDVGLLAIRGSAQMSAEALSPMVVADVLAYGLSTLDEQRATHAREQLTHVRQRLIQR
ncbi:MurR/RpiR family transcriptional regulator [Nocardioidaceae bacterium SCSIO 66511]|nr:MurR/RpiR family transcriptional regulator [Nocardioidaceae bacterium SCSIO 66511]